MMKRALLILAMLLLGMCLGGIVAARTTLRPRTEKLPPIWHETSELRSRTQTTHHWSLAPPWKWHLALGNYAVIGCGPYYQSYHRHWQYGPFHFEEWRETRRWPIAVEKAARAALLKKPWGDSASLTFDLKDGGWYVVALGREGQRADLVFTEQGRKTR
jgi:hypothetical protein